MRGADSYNESLFTTVKLEDFVPANHPLRPIRTWVNDALAKMDAKFSAMYEADIKGGGLHLRLDLAGLRVRGLRHRCLRAAHRRLARQQFHADRLRA